MRKPAVMAVALALALCVEGAFLGGCGSGGAPDACCSGQPGRMFAAGSKVDGAVLYSKNCAVCHGDQGAGDGKAAYLVFPRPRDLTKGIYKIKSVMKGPPTDEDLLRVVSEGMPGSAMPAWKGLMTEGEMRAVVAHLKTLSPALAEGGSRDPIGVPPEPRATEELLAEGRQLYEDAGCISCHGPQGRGDGSAPMSLKDEWGFPTQPADFTLSRFRGGNSARDVYLRLMAGMPGTPMPSFSDTLTPEQTWAVAKYVVSLRDPREPAADAQPVVTAARVGALPKGPSDAVWSTVPSALVQVQPLFSRPGAAAAVTVRAANDGREIAFLLEWADSGPQEQALRPQDFRDAAALEFPLGKTPTFYGMGIPLGPVNIWHWKADWEADLVHRADIEDVYPNTEVQIYPASKGKPGEIGDTATLHDPAFRSGRAAGNPMSADARKSPVEDLWAEGLGTLTSQPEGQQNVAGRGAWRNGTWRVVFRRALASKEAHDAAFVPGETTAVALAVWDGAGRDRNGQKTVSVWVPLIVGK